MKQRYFRLNFITLLPRKRGGLDSRYGEIKQQSQLLCRFYDFKSLKIWIFLRFSNVPFEASQGATVGGDTATITFRE